MMLMHPPEVDRGGFDPVLEGKRYGLSREQSLALWKRANAEATDATDATGQLDPHLVRKRFHALAARNARSEDRQQRGIGRTSRVDDEGADGARRAGGAHAHAARTPGRTTLVAAEAQRWGGPVSAQELAAASGAHRVEQHGALRGLRETKRPKAPGSPARALVGEIDQRDKDGHEGPNGKSSAARARRTGGKAPTSGAGRIRFAPADLGKLMPPIGPGETIEERRVKEAAVLSDHAAARAHATTSLTEFVESSNQQANGLRGLQPKLDARLRAGEHRAVAVVDAAAVQQVDAVRVHVAGAMAQAEAAAAAARDQIETAYAQSVVAINDSTTAARERIDAAYKTRLDEIDKQQRNQLTLVGSLYSKTADKFRAAGKAAGEHAITVANDKANEYLSHMIHRDDSALDGPLTDNRCKARADAARQVGEAYREGLADEAEKQIGKLNLRRITDVLTVAVIADQSRTELETARKNSRDTLDAARKQSLDAAVQTRASLLAQVDSAIISTCGGLDRHGSAQARAIQQQAGQLKQAIRQQRQAASAQTRESIEAAIAALHQGTEALLGGLTGTEVPEPEALDQALAEAHEQLGQKLAQMREAMTQGVAQSAQQLSGTASEGAQSIRQTAAAAIASANSMLSAARTSFGQLAASGAQSLQQLATGYERQAGETAKSARTGFEGVVNGLRETYGKLTQSFRDGAQNNVDAVRDGLMNAVDEDMDSKIEAEAKQAAAQVQPRWKSVVKWVIIIAIVIVVAVVIGPMVIGAVAAVAAAAGATAGVATVVGAVVGGALVGAASSAATTMVDNAVSGRALLEGVGKAALWGALGGAVGGAVSSALAPAMKGMSVAAKFALSTVSDVVVDTGLSLLQGNLSWDSFAQGLAMSLLTNGVTAHPKVVVVSGRFEQAGNNFGKRIGQRIRPPKVDAGGDAGASGASGPAAETGGGSGASHGEARGGGRSRADADGGSGRPRTDAGGPKPGAEPTADGAVGGDGPKAHGPKSGEGTKVEGKADGPKADGPKADGPKADGGDTKAKGGDDSKGDTSTTKAKGGDDSADKAKDKDDHAGDAKHPDPTSANADPKQPVGPGGFQSDAISLTGKGDKLGDAVKRLKPAPGKIDVVVHGDSDGFYVLKDGGYVKLDHRGLAAFIKKSGGRGKNIRLISCGTGESPTSIAQHLANKLGVEVTAPSNTLWIHPDGRLTIGKNPVHNTGEWNSFNPGTRPDTSTTPKTDKDSGIGPHESDLGDATPAHTDFEQAPVAAGKPLSSEQEAKLADYLKEFVPDAKERTHLHDIIKEVQKHPRIEGLDDWIDFSLRAQSRSNLHDEINELRSALETVNRDLNTHVKVGNDARALIQPGTADQKLPSFDLEVTHGGGRSNVEVKTVAGDILELAHFGEAINHARDKIINNPKVPKGDHTTGPIEAALFATWPQPPRNKPGGRTITIKENGDVTMTMPNGHEVPKGNLFENFVNNLNDSGRGKAPTGARQVDVLTVYDRSGNVIQRFVKDKSGVWSRQPGP